MPSSCGCNACPTRYLWKTLVEHRKWKFPSLHHFLCTDIHPSLKPSHHLPSIISPSTNSFSINGSPSLNLLGPLPSPNPLTPPPSLYSPLHTFMARVSLTSTDLSCPFSSKKTSLWPALFRSPSASALMWRIFPLSSSTWSKITPESKGGMGQWVEERRSTLERKW